jgi:hypothetical protein
MEEAILGQR